MPELSKRVKRSNASPLVALFQVLCGNLNACVLHILNDLVQENSLVLTIDLNCVISFALNGFRKLIGTFFTWEAQVGTLSVDADGEFNGGETLLVCL